VPAVAKSVPPVAAAIVALLFALILAASWRRRPAGQKALWAAGFALFGLAAVCEAAAQRVGWNPGLFRAYYLTGGVLTVAYLGAGSAWLLLPKRRREIMVGALALATVAAAATILLAPVDATAVALTPTGRPPGNGVLGGHAFLWAVALNTLGAVFLIGGPLYSIVRRRNVRASAWVAAGALIVGLATGLSRAGDYSFVYLGELVGIALMFAGFRLIEKPERASAPRAATLAAS
jgi:hypothetical protein